MADPARKVATYQDVLEAPEHLTAQVIDGELHLHPKPRLAHVAGASELGAELSVGTRRRGGDGGAPGWLILDEPELHLGPEPQILVPDLAGYRRSRLPQLPDEAFLVLAPDWVCEVLSPSTQRLDRGRKADLYAREGVRHLWFFDVDARQIEAFELSAGRWVRLGAYAEADAFIAPFEELALDVPGLLSALQPPT